MKKYISYFLAVLIAGYGMLTLLICMEGQVIFENEKDIKETLIPDDYVNIEPMVKHLEGTIENKLLRIK